MPLLVIPQAVWLLIIATVVMFCFITFAIGTPGSGRIKSTMIAALVSWATSYIFQLFTFSFQASQLEPPAWLFMGHTITVLLIGPLWGEFYYAILERKTDLFLRIVWTCIGISCVLAVVIEPFYQHEPSRYALIGANLAVAFTGFTGQLIYGYRTAGQFDAKKTHLQGLISGDYAAAHDLYSGPSHCRTGDAMADGSGRGRQHRISARGSDFRGRVLSTDHKTQPGSGPARRGGRRSLSRHRLCCDASLSGTRHFEGQPESRRLF